MRCRALTSELMSAPSNTSLCLMRALNLVRYGADEAEPAEPKAL